MSSPRIVPRKEYSLIFVRRRTQCGEKEVLLGVKLRGFGEGKLNGYGGKRDAGESMLSCAVRELKEESGLSIGPNSLDHVASLEFHMSSLLLMSVEVFLCDYAACSGVEIETDEMKPRWTLESELPALFQQKLTWPDDEFWLPRTLAGERLSGRFKYRDDADIESYTIWSIE